MLRLTNFFHIIALFLFVLLLIFGELIIAKGNTEVKTSLKNNDKVRSSLQKWLNGEWAQKYEIPFDWFVRQRHSVQNETFDWVKSYSKRRISRHLPIARMAGLSNNNNNNNNSPFTSYDGRYVIVKLDKLNRENRRKARYILTTYGIKDAHFIDDLHMLVYFDSKRATQVLSAFQADTNSAIHFSSITVMDIYSNPTAAKFKLSRVIRNLMNQCKIINNNNDNKLYSQEMIELNKLNKRLSLDVRTAPERENVVEESLQGIQSNFEPSSSNIKEEKTEEISENKCLWKVTSAVKGKGLVRLVLILSPDSQVQQQQKEKNIICRCNTLINKVIKHPAVRWMEIAIEFASPANNHATALVQQGYQDENKPIRPLWDAGINGSGEIIGMADSGIDFDSCFFHDPQIPVAIYPEINHQHRKVISFAPCDLIPGDYFIGDSVGGHGTHVAGSAAGHVPGEEGNSKYNGVAKGAKMFFMGLGCKSQNALSLPVDIVDVFRPGYNAGARVFSNSWGFFAPSEYTGVEKSIDSFASNQDESLFVFASGNEPRQGLMTPCRSKNMLCIGAHLNDFNSIRQNIIASFSTYGPTYDKRIKPELVTPGQPISSAYSDGDNSTMQCTVQSKRGTSMATAVAAGSAALIRQHLRKLEGLNNPSSALLKALMIHSTVNLNDMRKSGFGRLDLSIFFTPQGIKGWIRDRDAVSHHATNIYCFTTDSTSSEETDMIRVSLVWTDAGVALEGSPISLVNDLDLMVVDSNGVIYYAGGNEPDHYNVMEQIRLKPSKELSKGFQVYVYGSNVHDGIIQPYSLVVSGPNLKYISNCSTLSKMKCPNNCNGKGECIEGVCYCTPGYRSLDCSLCDEELLCQGHGTCSPKDLQCKCDNENFADNSCLTCKEGWYGASCSSDCKCSNRGECNKKTGECTCPQDEKLGGSGCFSGPNCEFCCRDFYGEKCNLKSYWCREDGWPVEINDTSSGYIQINGYGTYPPMTTCRWIMEAPKGQKIKLEYLKFNVEKETDILMLFDTITDEAQPVRVDTGTDPEGVVFVSSSNILSIVFASRWSHSRNGFLLRYTFEKPQIPNCTIPCVKDANCDNSLGEAFCICHSGHVGWKCEKILSEKEKEEREKSIEIKVDDDNNNNNNNNASTKFLLPINDEIQFIINNTKLSGSEVNLHLAFPGELFATENNGLSLRVAISKTNFSILNNFLDEEKVKITKSCKYIRIDMSEAIKNMSGILNFRINLLHNASIDLTIHDMIYFPVQAYLAKGESIENYNIDNDTSSSSSSSNNDKNLLFMYCSSTPPPNIPFISEDTNNESTNPSTEIPTQTPTENLTETPTEDTNNTPTKVYRNTSSGFIFLVLLTGAVVGGGLVAVYHSCRDPRESREDYTLEVMPAEEITLAVSTPEDENAEIYNNNNNDDGFGSADGLFSSLPLTPRFSRTTAGGGGIEGGRSNVNPPTHRGRRRGRFNYTAIEKNDNDNRNGEEKEEEEMEERRGSS